MANYEKSERLHKIIRLLDPLPEGQDWDLLPDYTMDIEAVHEAEGLLPEHLRDRYVQSLLGIVTSNTSPWIESEYWSLRRAKAEQIVDALLAVLEPEPAPIPTT